MILVQSTTYLASNPFIRTMISSNAPSTARSCPSNVPSPHPDLPSSSVIFTNIQRGLTRNRSTVLILAILVSLAAIQKHEPLKQVSHLEISKKIETRVDRRSVGLGLEYQISHVNRRSSQASAESRCELHMFCSNSRPWTPTLFCCYFHPRQRSIWRFASHNGKISQCAESLLYYATIGAGTRSSYAKSGMQAVAKVG